MSTEQRAQPPQLMTPAEVGRAFRVHPDTVKRWALAGRLPYIRTPGGHMRYERADVIALLVDGDER